MNAVDQLKDEYEAIALHLSNTQQISLLSDLNRSFRKILLLSAGSYFEHMVTSILIDFVKACSNNDERLVNFLEKQAISQKYHQLFSWGEKDKPEKPIKNANAFWKLFGENFKISIDQEVTIDKNELGTEIAIRKDAIKNAISSFVEIGHLRNIMVHSNFAAYSYDQKTTDEIYALFKAAEPFLDFLKQKLLPI